MSHRRRNTLWGCSLVITAAAVGAASGAEEQRGASSGDGQKAGASIVSIEVRGAYRYIRANGIPNHTTGRFPNRGNPNRVREQRYRYRVPADPQPAEKLTPLRMQPFGIAVNGVVFDPGAAEWWQNHPRSGWQYEPISEWVNLGTDDHNAHVQPNGAYHYHGVPTGLVHALGADDASHPKMVLLGYAADGFPIYNDVCHADPRDARSPLKKVTSGYVLREGNRPEDNGGPGGRHNGIFVEDYHHVPTRGDLDACNGHVGATPEHPTGTYHYHLTETFPFIPRFYRGTPDASFRRFPEGAPPPPPRHRPPGRGPNLPDPKNLPE